MNSEIPTFVAIGAGACGTVYEQAGNPLCVKKERFHKSPDKNLKNDYNMHKTIHNSFKKYSVDIHVPFPDRFIPADDPSFLEYQNLFPSTDQDPSDLLFTERILPLPQSLREALIDRYCPETLKDQARANAVNRNCLVRLYLGRIRPPLTRPSRFFTLNNYQLNLDQCLALELEVEPFITAMGKALAIMHWDAKVDARDVEFVLGMAPTFTKEHRHTQKYNFKSREVHFWLLDFNQVKEMTTDEAGLENAVEAYRVNDPYYPKPGRGPDSLWNQFRRDYMAQSRDILEEKQWSLAEKFLDMVEAMQKRVDEEAHAARDRIHD